MRPPQGSPYGIGFDLGGSSIKVVAVSPGGEVLSRDNVDFDSAHSLDWARKILGLKEAIQTERGSSAAFIGLSAPGLAANDGRAIAFMPGRLQGLEGMDWTDFLHTPTFVPVLNDAHAALLGEVWLGAAKGLANVLMLTLGTGVGGAAMVDGRLLRGHIGRAGHLGHICLDIHGPLDITRTPGSLEFMIGNYSIGQRSHGRYSTTHSLIAAHERGDIEASRFWLASVRALACAIVSFINVLDPELVIVGGGIARAGRTLFEPLSKFMDEFEWRPGGHQVKLAGAELGEFAGALGAARNAMREGQPAGSRSE